MDIWLYLYIMKEGFSRWYPEGLLLLLIE